MSMPIHSRPSFSDAWIVVPQPQKGSNTMSPGRLDAVAVERRVRVDEVRAFALDFVPQNGQVVTVIEPVHVACVQRYHTGLVPRGAAISHFQQDYSPVA